MNTLLCIRDGWIVNADTGEPLVRIDRNHPVGFALTIPHVGSFTFSNVMEVVRSLTETDDVIEDAEVPILVEKQGGLKHFFCGLSCRSRFPNSHNEVLYWRERRAVKDLPNGAFCEICDEVLR